MASYPVWNEESKQLLRELTFLYLFKAKPGPGAYTLADLHKKVVGAPAGKTVSEQNLRRFVFNQVKSPHRQALLEGLYLVVTQWLRSARSRDEVRRSAPVEMATKLGWLRHPKKKIEESSPTALALERAAAIADMFASVCNLDDGHHSSVARKLTGHSRCAGAVAMPGEKAGFVTYRYGTTPGNLVRSFTVVTPPSERAPFCWFENFYGHSKVGYARTAVGVALEMGGAIYMFGVLGELEGIKLLVIPNVNAKANIISGLVASSSADGRPLMSRVVLRRTSVSDIENLSPDEVPDALPYRKAIKAKLDQEVQWRLRNFVASRIDDQLFCRAKESEIPSNEMVREIGEWCDGRFTVAGRRFNPADLKHYPFNHALTCYSASERDDEAVTEPTRRPAAKGKRRRLSQL